jgi:oxygen-independent coproporphyrinogen-3 oxidase
MARALYIHWPFCLAKCPYCDFNSHVRERVEHAEWETALLSDLRFEASIAAQQPLESIFFGGGTPSLMPPALVARLIEEAERLWGFAPGIEITLEGNPSSVEAENYANLAACGINRASLGLQALDDRTLRFLGRLHGVEEGLKAVETAQKHFGRVSIDLIYARPGQSAEAWQSELAQALALGTSHLSLYQLTIEPGTRFETMVRKGDFTPLDDEAAADLFAQTREQTARAGLPAYEISNHACPGEESRHNLTYWRYQDYAGIGPGAHGRRGGVATVRHRKPENWLGAVAKRGDGIAEQRSLSASEQASEALLMGLRLREGIDPAALAMRFRLDEASLLDAAKVTFYQAQGLVWREGGRLGVSEAGMPLLDSLLGELVPEGLVSA